jgi:solute carrier family 25 (mitochondrial phosphate transporter), member 3
MIGGFRQVIQSEGAGALLTGVGPTFAGYFLQGAFKFGGYEFFKQQHINFLGLETASQYRTGVYLASSAAAEFFADIALVCCDARGGASRKIANGWNTVPSGGHPDSSRLRAYVRQWSG